MDFADTLRFTSFVFYNRKQWHELIDHAIKSFVGKIAGTDNWGFEFYPNNTAWIDLYSDQDCFIKTKTYSDTLLKHDNLTQTLFLDGCQHCYTSNNTKVYHQAKDCYLIEKIIMFCCQVTNCIYMWNNKLNRIYAINETYGNDTIYKNFDHDTLIEI
jgi:hypothetical protein